MPSQLNGLDRTLQWTHFGTPKTGPAPSTGQFVTWAQTSTNVARSVPHFVAVPHSNPPRFVLDDQMTVSVTFNANQSFVMSLVFTKPQQEQADLLNHEQGHYNITALLARDFFIDTMLLKQETFPSSLHGQARIGQIMRDTGLARVQDFHHKYDAMVHPQQVLGIMRGQAQAAWDEVIRRAFTVPRGTFAIPGESASQALNGTPHQMRLVSVLRQFNITI